MLRFATATILLRAPPCQWSRNWPFHAPIRLQSNACRKISAQLQKLFVANWVRSPVCERERRAWGKEQHGCFIEKKQNAVTKATASFTVDWTWAAKRNTFFAAVYVDNVERSKPEDYARSNSPSKLSCAVTGNFGRHFLASTTWRRLAYSANAVDHSFSPSLCKITCEEKRKRWWILSRTRSKKQKQVKFL